MISDEAVEAAAKTLAHSNGEGWLFEPPIIDGVMRSAEQSAESYLRRARAALEAAAPHMQRAALLDAADALEILPPKLKHQTVATLRLYAAEPWRIDNAGTCPSECAAGHPGREHDTA